MDRIVSIYNKIRNSRWSIPGAVSVLSVCLIAVVTLFFCLPEARAESVINTIWPATDGLNTYSMSDLANGDGNTVVKGIIDVQADKTYIIDGTGASKTNLSIKLNYVGNQGTVDSPAKVYITLRNVEIERTLDYEMLALTTSSNPVQFVVTVEGQCKFISRATGAENTPLISVENISYEVLKLSKVANSDNATYDDYVKKTTIEREVGLILGGKDPEASLELYYGRGGSGAVIGSREAGMLVYASSSEANAIITNLNNQAIVSEGQVYVKSAEIAQQLRDNGFVEYDYVGSNTFYPEYQYQNKHTTGAGSITIGGENGDKPLRLSIVNEGFGAAIGGGSGSQVGTSAPNASKITINGGTIYINSTRQDVAAIGTGVTINQGVAAPSVEGIEINGGSIKIESAGLKFYKNPVNADGDRVYELKADTSTNAGGLTLSNLANLASGVDIPITYLYEPGLQFASNLENITLSATSDAPGYNILDVNVGKGFINYVYQGTGHAGTSTDRSDMLYFYLPATETTSLTIKDEFGVGVGDGYSKFVVKDSLGNVVDPISTDYSQSASRTYVLLKGETYYLSAEYIPNGLEIRQVTLNSGGVETNAGYSSVTGYTIPTSSTSVVATVVYGGTIDIQYSAGLVVGDEANHNVTLPTADYEYGTDVLTLPNLGTIMKDCPVGGSVTDLVFEGWMYTDASGRELGWITHITGKPMSGGSATDHYELFSDVMQSDGKIYLKAKWKIEINYVLGTGEVWSTGMGDKLTLNYGSEEPNYKYNYGITSAIPAKEGFAFVGWTVDDGTEFYNYSTGLDGTGVLSTLTSHNLYANYERSGFSVYIDASALSERYAVLQCIKGAMDILVKKTDGTLATVVVDGKTYYYSQPLADGTQIRVILETASGYKMSNLSIVCSTANTVSTDETTGECFVDFKINKDDVYISTQATFSPIEYDIYFKDGKQPNEYLWNGYHFTFDIEDIEAGKSIGDIIREGLGDASLSDEDIANAVNTIPKNNRFTDFSGWTLDFVDGVMNSDAVISDILSNSGTVTYGTLTFTANWSEYDKYAINMNLLERQFMEDGTFIDMISSKVVPVLYYYTEGGKMYPVYTETIEDPVTGEETTTAYAKAGDKILIALHKANAKGRPMGEPIVEGIAIEELYYVYESKLDEQVRADVQGNLQTFTVKDDVKDDTVIEVYMTFSLKQYSIIYWDLRGYDNSANPIKYTIFDDFDFTAILPDVDWLLVCQDQDASNDDDVTTEVIYGVNPGGKLITDGPSASRGYLSNLILKPDWDDYEEEMYTIEIVINGEVYGEITVSHPWESLAYAANDMIVLSVKPMEGYRLVANSLVYKKAEKVAPLSIDRGLLLRNTNLVMPLDEIPIKPINAADGVYIFTMPANDIIISASFEICEYNITYSDMTSDIVNVNPEKYTINSEIVLEDAVREGYNFLGWYDQDGNRILKIANRTGDITLTPVFELKADTPPVDDPDEPVDPPADDPDDPDNPDNPVNPPADEPDNKPGDPDDGNDGDGGVTDGTDDGDKNNDKEEKPGISGRPSNVIINGNVTSKPVTSEKTGDTTDVSRLVLISVAAMLVMMIVVLKKKENKREA